MADNDDIPSPVRALREAFGDSRPPDISRKITACVACRKQKIKCYMKDSKPPCTRCQKRGLSCTVNRSLQMLLESDTVWKHSLETKMKKLESVVANMANYLTPEARQHVLSQLERSPMLSSSPKPQGGVAEHSDEEELVMDLESGPGAFPGTHITQPIPRGPPQSTDLITRGIITLSDAQSYFDIYQNRLDHFRYRIMGDLDSFESIRQVSPLLTAAVCTVGALHLASNDFERCYEDFKSLCAAQSLFNHPTVDDVRALCIGAFWLQDLAWSLVALAVRSATELQLHRSMARAMQGDRTHYLRTRLYLLVYVCDHQCSIVYGRPPMTRECETIRNIRQFLKCEHATIDDGRLASQVLRWSMCTSFFDTFGVEVDRPLPDSDIPRLRQFSIALDDLRAEFADKFNVSAHVGNYPAKGVTLQYHFAKLYLCSHAFRGVTSGRFPPRPHKLAMDQDVIASEAVLAALSIIMDVESDSEIQSHLNGLPVYFDVMVAFAAVFVFKVSTNFASLVRVDILDTKNRLERLVTTLKRTSSSMHPRHPLVNITKGIDSITKRIADIIDDNEATNVTLPTNQFYPNVSDSSMLSASKSTSSDLNWDHPGNLDPKFMTDFDFLSSLNMDFALDSTFDSNNPYI